MQHRSISAVKSYQYNENPLAQTSGAKLDARPASVVGPMSCNLAVTRSMTSVSNQKRPGLILIVFVQQCHIHHDHFPETAIRVMASRYSSLLGR